MNNQNDKNIFDMVKRNSIGMGCYITTISIIAVAYLLEVVKHNRTLGYFLLVFFTLAIPAAITVIIKIIKPESEVIKVVILFGFAIPWGIMLFTANNNLVFTYSLVIMIALNSYANKHFAILSGVVFNVISISSVVFQILTREITSEDIVSFEIQVLLLILCSVFNVLIAKTNEVLNNIKITEVEQEKNNTGALLDQIVSASKELTAGIALLNDKMESLNDSSKRTSAAMDEVNSGTTESAEAVQTQLVMTEEIQSKIEIVSNNSNAINDSVKKTREAVNEGTANMNTLAEEVENAKIQSDSAAEKLSELENYTKQMQSIIELINNVADQTDLLALNASIEAARAGDTGKGFAVVASEISNLANQTQAATEDIHKLIDNINNKLSDVDAAIKSFVEGSSRQYSVANKTMESLNEIKEDTISIEENSLGLNNAVTALYDANKKIVDAVQNISAILEEVAANSNETYEASLRNTDTVKEMHDIVSNLNEQTSLLEKHL